MNKLQTYLKAHGISQEAFARKVGVTQPSVHRWLTGSAQPSKRIMLVIERETSGAVPVLSWFAGSEQ